MHNELTLIAARQGGLVTRAQAHRAGYTERELRTLIAVGGRWRVVRRGVYAEQRVMEAAMESRDGLAALRDRAAHLTMVRPHLMSHDSAARAWGLPLLDPAHALVHVTREGVRGTRTDSGVKHHLTRLRIAGSIVIDGMPVTGLARTALDIAREHGFEAGTVTVDAARRRGVTTECLREELALIHHWPNVARARSAVEASDPGAESPGETLLRLALVEADLGEVVTQFPMRLSSQLAWGDLRIGCHIFEFDGRSKFRRFEDGGVLSGSIEDALWNERTRQNEICELGLGVSRVVWDELFGRRRRGTIERLRAEYRLTCERYGTRLPETLAEFAERMSDQRNVRIFGALERSA